MAHPAAKAASAALRRAYAGRISRLAGIDNPRIERAFAEIPREDFLPPPPWTVSVYVVVRVADVPVPTIVTG